MDSPQERPVPGERSLLEILNNPKNNLEKELLIFLYPRLFNEESKLISYLPSLEDIWYFTKITYELKDKKVCLEAQDEKNSLVEVMCLYADPNRKISVEELAIRLLLKEEKIQDEDSYLYKFEEELDKTKIPSQFYEKIFAYLKKPITRFDIKVIAFCYKKYKMNPLRKIYLKKKILKKALRVGNYVEVKEIFKKNG